MTFFGVQYSVQRTCGALPLILIVVVEERVHDVRLPRQGRDIVRELGQFAVIVVVVEPLRRRREPLLVPSAVMASVQAYHRQRRISDLPYRRYRVGDALRFV